MKFTLTTSSDANLLSRKEVSGSIDFSGATPSRTEVIDAIATELKAKPELVVIQKIDTKFGSEEAVVEAHVYKTLEALKAHEPAHMVKRNERKAEEKPAEEEKPAAAPAPTEDKKTDEKAAEVPKKEVKAEDTPHEEEKPAEVPKEDKKEEKSAPEEKSAEPEVPKEDAKAEDTPKKEDKPVDVPKKDDKVEEKPAEKKAEEPAPKDKKE